jgi:hypothetical protein
MARTAGVELTARELDILMDAVPKALATDNGILVPDEMGAYKPATQEECMKIFQRLSFARRGL